MRLILHTGLNKAGSTFMQRLFEQNHGRLIENRIFYPVVQDMPELAGSHTGNAFALADALRREYCPGVAHFLERCRRGAEAHGAETLLLSSEALHHVLVMEGRLDLLVRMARLNGCDTTQLVTFFRSPFEHAVSAYAHRSGRGVLPDFETWIAPDSGAPTRYEFWDELTSFRAHVLGSDQVTLTILPYSWNLRQDWEAILGLALEEAPKDVNVSVSCTEAEILRVLAVAWPSYIPTIRHRWKTLARSAKAPDLHLRRKWHEKVAAIIAARPDDMEYLAGVLKENPSLSMPSAPDAPPEGFVLSQAQILFLVDAVSRRAVTESSLGFRARNLAKRLYFWLFRK